MKELIRARAKGLRSELTQFFHRVDEVTVTPSGIGDLLEMVAQQMRALEFDTVRRDKVGNLIGVIEGYGDKEPLVLLSHIDISSATEQRLSGMDKDAMTKFKAGVISGVFAGGLLKRALVPLDGDVIICCVPRLECGDFGIQYLFDGFLKSRSKKLKGVVLCEPTDFNIHLGHKGRMEYEIVVKGKLQRNFLEQRGMNMLGTMFPLINKLEKISKELPSDSRLGGSDLRIKDVRYNGYRSQDQVNEFRVVVDRAFIPEESGGGILDKAKLVAQSVYNQEPDVTVNTLVAKERVKTYTGMNLVAHKEFQPWLMESHHPFALDSLKSLTESGIAADFGYWKTVVTEGSYTYAQRSIPTIGFGAGSEKDIACADRSLTVDMLEKAIYGHSLIIYRNIGLPTFGWSTDEI